MKKSILTIAILCLAAISGKAQVTGTGLQPTFEFRDKIQLGIKLGTNYSNVYNVKGGDFQTDAKFGLATGVFVAVPFNKLIGFQPEILISQKGFRATGNIPGSSYDFTRTSTFVDVPLLISVKPVRFLNILAGPQYSYMVQEQDVFANNSLSNQQETEFKNAGVRRNILSFLGGLDLELKHFVISTRVGWDASNNNGDGSASSPRYNNVWYQATLGFRLANN